MRKSGNSPPWSVPVWASEKGFCCEVRLPYQITLWNTCWPSLTDFLNCGHPLSLCLMFPLLLFFGLIPFQTSYTVLISRHPSAVLVSHGQATVDYLQVCTEEGSVIFLLTHAQLREAHQWDCKCTFGEWPYLLMNMFMYLNERWCVRACVHWRQIDWLCLWIPPQDRKTF